ncbi:hypothetical protein SAMN06265222_1563, partial [Neorhodopirellula lusitana]
MSVNVSIEWAIAKKPPGDRCRQSEDKCADEETFHESLESHPHWQNVSDVRAAAIDVQANEKACHRRSVTIAWLFAA